MLRPGVPERVTERGKGQTTITIERKQRLGLKSWGKLRCEYLQCTDSRGRVRGSVVWVRVIGRVTMRLMAGAEEV